MARRTWTAKPYVTHVRPCQNGARPTRGRARAHDMSLWEIPDGYTARIVVK